MVFVFGTSSNVNCLQILMGGFKTTVDMIEPYNVYYYSTIVLMQVKEYKKSA